MNKNLKKKVNSCHASRKLYSFDKPTEINGKCSGYKGNSGTHRLCVSCENLYKEVL